MVEAPHGCQLHANARPYDSASHLSFTPCANEWIGLFGATLSQVVHLAASHIVY